MQSRLFSQDSSVYLTIQYISLKPREDLRILSTSFCSQREIKLMNLVIAGNFYPVNLKPC
jgi:hypothetical protein